jgi:hypothetical protein
MAKGQRMIQPMSTPMSLLVTTVAGFLVLIIYLMIVPFVAGTVEGTMPPLGTTSEWNSTYNTELPKPSEVYTSNIGIISACIAFVFLGLLFFYLRGMIL